MSGSGSGDGGRPPDDVTETVGGGGGGTLPAGALARGRVLGGRYELVRLLGRGGMGVVWQALDLKLRVTVALKALRKDVAGGDRALELIRREVRAARDVVSPNVCRVYDLVEADGRELVSMEYVDGTTLLGLLEEERPLELPRAREIAAQFLAGLEAIHRAGLVHRDVKPENIMVTRAGRVVLMDFGLARSVAADEGSVSGTRAYMAPEQARGERIDLRADVYSAGVVLAEMIAPSGVRDRLSREKVWQGLRADPPQVPDGPWAPVLARAVARDPEERFPSAQALIRALEEHTLRVTDAEEAQPYPGLAPFGEEDAGYFFGREAEVEAVWSRLEQRHLLAIIGPSGAGKSSFLRAGLIPARPEGWGHAVCTPGGSPTVGLARALVGELSGDPEAVHDLVRTDDPDAMVSAVSRWRRLHDEALLVVDQFEELFTQNPPEAQARFADLLGRLVLEAGVHLLLAMRDDFLIRCHDHEPLTPLFDALTPLTPPVGAALRRAVVQPALKCGYRFSDDALVDEMLAELEGERGALPLLAFAMSRLWQERDRERGLLTREASERIGGVAGALAQHAEATLARIGERHGPLVREIFRNLVTAEGTRAARDQVELLSVFDEGQRRAAGQVMRELIDARLLTTFEVTGADGAETERRIEVIHESLLAAWPRLVRWQTQDAEGAQLRDQLRQAARIWEDHGRSDDLLWSGTAFKEFQLWRERYPGGLSDTEEDFAAAMTRHAGRRRRRRRLAVVVGFALLLAVAVVVGVSRQRAVSEARRAESGKLIALGEADLETYPTASLAAATASLQLADTLEGRLLALRALSRGPPVTVCPLDSSGGYYVLPGGMTMSRSGGFLVSGFSRVELRHQDGGEPTPIEHPENDGWMQMGFAPGEVLLTGSIGTHSWWSPPEVERPTRVREDRGWLVKVLNEDYLGFSFAGDRLVITRWPFDGGPGRVVGEMEPWHEDAFDEVELILASAVDETGSRLAYAPGNSVLLRSLEDWERPAQLVGRHDHRVSRLGFHPSGEQLATVDQSGEIRIWSTASTSSSPLRTLDLGGVPTGQLTFDRSGRWLAGFGSTRGLHLFDLAAPLGTAALTLKRSDDDIVNEIAFHPAGSWLVTGRGSLGFWPLSHAHPLVLEHGGGRVMDLAFTPDGGWLVTVTSWERGAEANGRVRAWPLDGQNDNEPRVLLEAPRAALIGGLDIAPSGVLVAVSIDDGTVNLLPLEGGNPRRFPGRGPDTRSHLVAFSPDGRLLAHVPRGGPQEFMVIRIWDLESGEGRDVGAVGGSSAYLDFIDDHRLRWAGDSRGGDGGGERIFDLVNGSVEIVSEGDAGLHRTGSSRGDFLLTTELEGRDRARISELSWSDRRTGETRRIRTHGEISSPFEIDPTDRWLVSVGGYERSVVRVGPVSGEEPHLLHGHTDVVTALAVSPDGRWIASGSLDGTVRLWPFPDMSRPPLHGLPHDRLLAKLSSLTNLRVVRDERSPYGWKLEIGSFPGWKTVPEW